MEEGFKRQFLVIFFAYLVYLCLVEQNSDERKLDLTKQGHVDQNEEEEMKVELSSEEKSGGKERNEQQAELKQGAEGRIDVKDDAKEKFAEASTKNVEQENGEIHADEHGLEDEQRSVIEVDDNTANWNAEKADEIVATYVRHRNEGMSQAEITKNVFKVEFTQPDIDHFYPFVCGDVFKASSDMIVIRETITGKKPEELTDGDVVFVLPNDFWFFHSEVLPKITTRFILITHKSDILMPVKDMRTDEFLESPLLVHWFCLAPNKEYSGHPKLSHLPYGLHTTPFTNKEIDIALNRSIPDVYNIQHPKEDRGKAAGSEEDDPRPTLLYQNFNKMKSLGRGHRRDHYEAFMHLGEYVKVNKMPNLYLSDMAQSKFVLSPPGQSLDTYRHTESILFKAIPVVEDLNPIMKRDFLNLAPVFYLKEDWRMNPPEEDDLLKFKPTLGLGRSICLAEFWLEKINSVRKKIKELK